MLGVRVQDVTQVGVVLGQLQSEFRSRFTEGWGSGGVASGEQGGQQRLRCGGITVDEDQDLNLFLRPERGQRVPELVVQLGP